MRELPTGDVTFVFTDIEDSTVLFHELGDDYPPLLKSAHRTVAACMEREGGVVVRIDGDGLFAAFPDAVRAVAAACDAQRALEMQGRVRVRVGMHTGPAAPVGGNYVALAVHLAARVAGAAHGGQVLISEATAALCAGALPAGAVVHDLGRFHLKGFQAPQRLFALALDGRRDDRRPRARPASGNVGPATTKFVGREGDIATVADLLRTHRVLSLLGPGGVGKTRLAVELALSSRRSFPGGTWFVPLAGRDDPGAPAELVARALGSEHLDDPDALLASLAPAHALVVLDNCEHLREPAATLVAELSTRCPDLRVLVTSREPLGVPGEQLYWVEPLDVGTGAVALFVDRANLVRARTWTGSDLDAAERICRELDGLPLAIELAAARTAVLTPAEIADRLGDRFALLTGGHSNLEHHRSLHAALAWSDALLSADEQRLFRQLSVFRGGFTLQAAEAVARDTGQAILDVVASLVRKSLLDRHDDGGSSRFSMLESVRQYAWNELERAREAQDVRRRHAQWCLELATEADANLRGREQGDWLDRLEREHENLRAALDALRTTDPRAHCELTLRLRRFWIVRGYWSVGAQECAAAATADTDPCTRARASVCRADFAVARGEYSGVRSLLEEASAVATEHHDDALLADATFQLASLVARQDDGGAIAVFDAARAAAIAAGNEALAAEAAASSGALRAKLGDIAGARNDLDWAERTARVCADVRLLAYTLNRLGVVELEQGLVDAARAHLVEAIALARTLGDRNAEAGCLFHLSRTTEESDPNEAERMLERVLALGQELSDEEGISVASLRLGKLAASAGRHRRALALLGQAEAGFRKLGREPLAREAAEAAAAVQGAETRAP